MAEKSNRNHSQKPSNTAHAIGVAMQHSVDAVEIWDPTGRIVYVNPAFERLTGHRSAEAVGQISQDLLRSDAQPPSLHQMMWRTLRSGRSCACTYISRHKEGRRFSNHVSITPLFDVNRKLVNLVVVRRDLSEPERQHREVTQARSELQNLVDTFPAGVAVHRGGRVMYANDTWLNLLGFTKADQVIGRGIFARVVPEDRDRARTILHFICEKYAPEHDTTLRFSLKDGGYKHLEISAGLPVRITGLEAVLVTGRDVSHRHQRAGELRLTERMAQVGTLAAGMAHEINNPLTYVVGNLDLADEALRELETGMLRQGAHHPAVDRLQQALLDVRSGVARVRNIVRDMKALSRDDDEYPTRIDLRSLVSSTIKMAANEIRFRGRLESDFRFAPDVQGNEARLGQVFLNLLVNAAQALPEERRNENRIKVTISTDPRGWAVVTVQDNGKGIPSESLAQIFDPFFTTKPPGEGTGIGLSICHSIISQMEGSIQVESEVGQGTTIRVLLPPAGEEIDEITRRIERLPSVEVEPRRVLVIDDEPLVLRMLKKSLRQHDVTAVSSGSRAIELCRNQDFDMILCDLMMPEMDGIDIYKEIEALRPVLARRMVFMTGGAFTPRARSFMANVENACIEKPFHASDILAIVQQLPR